MLVLRNTAYPIPSSKGSNRRKVDPLIRYRAKSDCELKFLHNGTNFNVEYISHPITGLDRSFRGEFCVERTLRLAPGTSMFKRTCFRCKTALGSRARHLMTASGIGTLRVALFAAAP